MPDAVRTGFARSLRPGQTTTLRPMAVAEQLRTAQGVRQAHCGSSAARCSSGTALIISTSFGSFARPCLRAACAQELVGAPACGSRPAGGPSSHLCLDMVEVHVLAVADTLHQRSDNLSDSSHSGLRRGGCSLLCRSQAQGQGARPRLQHPEPTSSSVTGWCACRGVCPPPMCCACLLRASTLHVTPSSSCPGHTRELERRRCPLSRPKFLPLPLSSLVPAGSCQVLQSYPDAPVRHWSRAESMLAGSRPGCSSAKPLSAAFLRCRPQVRSACCAPAQLRGLQRPLRRRACVALAAPTELSGKHTPVQTCRAALPSPLA